MLFPVQPDSIAGDTLPVIHISPMGNLGNRLIQFAIAQALAARAGGARFSNVHLPEFGIQHPPVAGDFPRTEIVTAQTVPLDRLARALAGGALQRVDIRTYGQRVENLPPARACARFLPTLANPESTGPGELLCNLRQGDILDGHHPDYVLIPPAFYAELAESTGLRPVFMGQLDDTPYLHALRARFPQARFLPSEGAVADFERMRSARHIVPAISTFSWMAAWLSDADSIHLPVLGLLNPAQNRGVNLLPLDDPRYRFHQFPIHYACPVQDHAAAHAAIDRLWRQLPPERLSAIVAREPPPRPKTLYLEAFDEAFYRAAHPDVADAIAAGHLPSGWHHFEMCGFEEGRAAFPLDRGWYGRSYPMAAIEIAQNEYWDAEHHWLEMGRARGYRRCPEPALNRRAA